jgi:hypothetical protein
MQHIRRIGPSAAVLAAALSSMALYGCGQNNQQTAANTAAAPPALPLTTGAETAPVYAPPVTAMPSAPRPKIVRVASQADQYAYVDQAQTMGAALGSAPPDYGFDYDGVRPWVWRTSNNALRLVEPIDGGYRYYYYQPGATLPYLIQDPQYAYGFDNGQLVVVYDSRGNVLPAQYMDQRADYAGRFLARAQALYNASLRNQRSSVIAANWAARRTAIDAQQAEWAQEQSQYSAWQAYHQEHDAEQQAYWQAERQRRDAAASQFNQWHDAGYQGPPPSPPPYAGVAGAAAVGGLIGGLIAGQHHDNGGPPPQGAFGRPGGPGFNTPQGAPYGAQQAAIQQGRQQQAQQDAQRQAQAEQQAQAASTARTQAIQQGRQQEAAQYAAQQAAAQQQARQIAAARSQQAAQDAAAQHQQQAAAQRQAQEAQRAQNQQAHQQQAAQAATQHQAEAAAARAQAMQAHEQQAAQDAAQHQAEASARAQSAQAHQQQAAQAAVQHQAQAAQASHAAAAAHAAPHPSGPPPGGHDPKRDGDPHPAQN